MTAIQISGVTKTFGDVAALADIDLDVQSGENIAILGPSGSGKSTLLRIIAGLEAVDTGEIRFGGEPQNGIPPEKRDVAIVFQSYALYPHLSSRENITLGLRHGRSSAARRQTLAPPTSPPGCRSSTSSIASSADVGWAASAHRAGQGARSAQQHRAARRTALRLDAQLHAALRVEIAGLLQSVGATGINVTHDQPTRWQWRPVSPSSTRGALNSSAPPMSCTGSRRRCSSQVSWALLR